MLLGVASLGALSPSQLDELALEHCHGRVFLDGGSNTGDSVRSFLSGAPTATTAAATAAAAATNGSARLPQLFRQLLFGDLLLHRRVDVRPLLEDGASDVNGPQYHAARLIANGVVPG